MKTTAMLTEMLHEERRLRIEAERSLAWTKVDNDGLRERRDELAEQNEFLTSRNKVLMRENADLSYSNSFRSSDKFALEQLQLRYDQLVASMAHLHQPIVERIFNEDPADRRKNKIFFIKEVREQTGLGLKEAKDLVDNFLRVDEAQSLALLNALGGEKPFGFKPEDHTDDDTK